MMQEVQLEAGTHEPHEPCINCSRTVQSATMSEKGTYLVLYGLQHSEGLSERRPDYEMDFTGSDDQEVTLTRL
jgi:hypothetical protein